MRFFIKFVKLLSVAAFAFFVATVGFYVSQKCYHNNFHVVEDGVMYRSAQPTAEDIKRYKDEYGIKTIISLKKKQPTKQWWIDETTESKKLGITHYDVALSSTMVAPMYRMIELTKLMRDVPRPVLVHCEGGSDRTGLAMALYFYTRKHMKPEKAESKGLSILYGHLPYFGAETANMSVSFNNFVRYTREKSVKHK